MAGTIGEASQVLADRLARRPGAAGPRAGNEDSGDRQGAGILTLGGDAGKEDACWDESRDCEE